MLSGPLTLNEHGRTFESQLKWTEPLNTGRVVALDVRTTRGAVVALTKLTDVCDVAMCAPLPQVIV
jgi:hypothetical protein